MGSLFQLIAIFAFFALLIFALYKQRNNKAVFLLFSAFIFAAMLLNLSQNMRFGLNYFKEIEIIASILP